jgi:hypothetical protein
VAAIYQKNECFLNAGDKDFVLEGLWMNSSSGVIT